MKVGSSAFSNGSDIPIRFTCEGENTNPPLTISDIPENAKSIAIICDDPDAPYGAFVHWVVWNIDPSNTDIPENAKGMGIEGINDMGRIGYSGPCPPRGPSHTYRFFIFALDTMLDLNAGASRSQLEKAMEGYILAKAETEGEFKR
jgi:Raf kinase inhibitor-like YbhB/YbcL family protein